MKSLIISLILITATSVLGKIDMSHFKDSVIIGQQIVSISQAEVVINKMPMIGSKKLSRYIVVSLKSADGKKIKATYKIISLSFPGCTRQFSSQNIEKRDDGCVVRKLPDWVGKGLMVAITIEDEKGKRTSLKAQTTEIEVH